MTAVTAGEQAPVVELHPGARVLVTRLDYLGDVVISLTVVDALRRRWPGVEIDYLTRAPAADLLAGDPRLARVVRLERRPTIRQSLDVISALRSRRYDAALDLYANPRSAWLVRASGARVRVGAARGWRRRLYTHAVTVPPEVRAAPAWHAAVAAPLGVTGASLRPRLPLSPDEREAGRRALEALACAGSGPRVGIHPGGKWPVKRWPVRHVAALARRLRDALDARVVLLTGAGDDARWTHEVASCLGEAGVGVAPPVDVRRAAARVAALDAFVASDGGMAHVSVAVGTPTVAIFGSAEPDVWFPYESTGPFRAAYEPLACRPCHRHECPLGHANCVEALEPVRVMAEIERVLDEARRGRSGSENDCGAPSTGAPDASGRDES